MLQKTEKVMRQLKNLKNVGPFGSKQTSWSEKITSQVLLRWLTISFRTGHPRRKKRYSEEIQKQNLDPPRRSMLTKKRSLRRFGSLETANLVSIKTGCWVVGSVTQHANSAQADSLAVLIAKHVRLDASWWLTVSVHAPTESRLTTA